MRIVILGAPGSGKGTQAAALARHFAIPHISSGELFRDSVDAGTALGREVAAYLDRGDLVPDDVAVRVVAHALAKADDGYILDGFPRTLPQAELLEAAGELADADVFLAISDDVARQRLADRMEGRSDDRSPEIVENRLEQFHAETDPVVHHYRQLGRLVTVDGAQPEDQVTADILAALADV